MFGGAFCSPLIRIGNSFEYFYNLYLYNGYMYIPRKLLLALNMENGGID